VRLAKHRFDVLKVDLMHRPILCALRFMPFELVKLAASTILYRVRICGTGDPDNRIAAGMEVRCHH
jgi:hypothetical protein